MAEYLELLPGVRNRLQTEYRLEMRRWFASGEKPPLNKEKGPISDPSFEVASRCYLVVAPLHFVCSVDAEPILFRKGGIVILANRANLELDGCTAAK